MEMWAFSLYYGTVTLRGLISDITHGYDNFSYDIWEAYRMNFFAKQHNFAKRKQ